MQAEGGSLGEGHEASTERRAQPPVVVAADHQRIAPLERAEQHREGARSPGARSQRGGSVHHVAGDDDALRGEHRAQRREPREELPVVDAGEHVPRGLQRPHVARVHVGDDEGARARIERSARRREAEPIVERERHGSSNVAR